MGLNTIQRKHTWFVLLMILIISWNSAAVASSQTTHLKMLISFDPSVSHDDHAMQHIAKGACHTLSLQHSNITDHVHHLNPDCIQSLNTQHAHASDCQDCNQFHCQTLSHYISSSSIVNDADRHEISHLDPSSSYYVQYSKGYWQEILRPPKA